MRDELCQSFALLPRCSKPRVWVAKPRESGIEKFICRRSVPPCALSVERPAKNELCRAILFSSHSAEPMVEQCGLPDAGPGNNCDDVDIIVCPCTIQKSDILLSTKHIASGNG